MIGKINTTRPFLINSRLGSLTNFLGQRPTKGTNVSDLDSELVGQQYGRMFLPFASPDVSTERAGGDRQL